MAYLRQCLLIRLLINSDCHNRVLTVTSTAHAHVVDVDVTFPQNISHLPDDAWLVSLAAEDKIPFQADVNAEGSHLGQMGNPIFDPADNAHLTQTGQRAGKPGLDRTKLDLDGFQRGFWAGAQEDPFFCYPEPPLLGGEVSVDQVDEDAGNGLNDTFGDHGP